MKSTVLVLTICSLVLHIRATGNNGKFASLKTCLGAANVNTSNLVSRDDASDSQAYTALNFQWNKCCGEKDPLAYLLVQNAVEVQNAIKCAKKVKGLRVVPKGGGHSYGKYSFGDSESLIIDLQKLTTISVNPSTQTVVVGPGVLLGPLVYNLWNNGQFGIPVGACPTVGVGFVLGGGFGEFSRLHGMAVDSLLEVDMVDATGNLLTANKNSHSDLFWALRGGGAGSFGIITRFQFKLFKTPDQVVQGNTAYGIDEFPAVFAAWQRFVGANQPRNVNAILRILPTQANIITLKVIELQTAAEAEAHGQGVVQNILTNTFPASSITMKNLTYLDFFILAGNDETGGNTNLTYPSQLATLGRHDFVPAGTLRAKTFYVPKFIGASEINTIFNLLKTRPPSIIIIMRPLGGAINDVGATDTAFVHRKQNFFEVDVLYIGPPAEESGALTWMNRFFLATQFSMGHTESYQNHLDIGLDFYLQRYYGVNVPRLVGVKIKYDGGNYFRNPQSVPPYFSWILGK